MGNKLKNKVAIITGGGRGIGKAIAKRFAQEGYHLMLVARTETELEKAAAEIIAEYHTPVLTSAIDISNEQAVQQMVKQTVNEFGKITSSGARSFVLRETGVTDCSGPWAQITMKKRPSRPVALP